MCQCPALPPAAPAPPPPLPSALDDLRSLTYLRATLGESLRMYPQPPLLIRRALGEDTLPPGLGGDPAGYPIGKGADIFISVWNLHRCRALRGGGVALPRDSCIVVGMCTDCITQGVCV